MTRRGLATVMRAGRVFLGALLLACVMVPSAPQPARACGVSYGHLPSYRADPTLLGRSSRCSNAASLTGAGIVAVLAISAAVLAGVRAFRRGEATAGTLPGRTGPAEALSAYLTIAGIARSHGQPVDDDDTRTNP
ncbi:hypothetical protein GCM10010116_35270 [Microbispora rosea subsp. aerata]|nr:hypothetical protein GCM10010116_35270 [Microbispora rosea subsp. aerata]GIH56541.1 hypothetical protein Mro02_34550 [Microbispora rosea subsp. aerata]GLJ81930.1 hypothetical protein GCM10017588_06550 [Microbispora rosea subsp. aerata]